MSLASISSRLVAPPKELSWGRISSMELKAHALLSDANLLAYYPFDDRFDFADGYDLTENGAIVYATGRDSNAGNLGVAGINYWNRLVDIFGLTNWSVGGWIKLNSEIGAGFSGITAFGKTSPNSFTGRVNYEYNGGTRRLVFERTKPGVASNLFTYNLTLGLLKWWHIFITWDGSTVRGYV